MQQESIEKRPLIARHERDVFEQFDGGKAMGDPSLDDWGEDNANKSVAYNENSALEKDCEPRRVITVPRPTSPSGQKQPSKFVDNHVKTSKYSPWTFVFVNALEQFRKRAYFYFLVQSVLSCFPEVSPFIPLSVVGPFLLFLAIAMARVT